MGCVVLACRAKSMGVSFESTDNICFTGAVSKKGHDFALGFLSESLGLLVSCVFVFSCIGEGQG